MGLFTAENEVVVISGTINKFEGSKQNINVSLLTPSQDFLKLPHMVDTSVALDHSVNKTPGKFPVQVEFYSISPITLGWVLDQLKIVVTIHQKVSGDEAKTLIHATDPLTLYFYNVSAPSVWRHVPFLIFRCFCSACPFFGQFQIH